MAKLHVGRVDDSKFEVDLSSLTRHTIILGATGSGKTVLSKVVVEEAALQGIPTFAIDPKGDIGNLAFKSSSFDFSKWSGKEADALRLDRKEYAASLRKLYGDRLKEFGVSPDAPARFEKIPVRIFTPKSSAGLPVGISPDLAAPKDFSSLLASDVSSAADLLDLTSYSLLRLAGYAESDRSEITFVSAILENAWKAGQSLTVRDLMRRIENPPVSMIGSLHVSDVLSDNDRRKLVTKLNLLVSDPKLRSWSAAEPFNFSEMFKEPSINVLDLRNIQSEQEKHLFVELTLQQLFQWMIKQGSAQTLRYLLYFDEIAGYCPPVREPSSKKLLLLLIKQARAFGLGLMLASQNAVDLDYKVISNANVRFIGRLGAQRDIQRVSVGLELGSHAEKEIGRLQAGEFFCNIFEPRFQGVIKSRWPLTYHRGPLENSEIAELMADFKKDMPVAESVAQAVEGAEQEEEEQPLPAKQKARAKEEEEPAIPPSPHEAFMALEKRFEPKDLAAFIRLGSNVKEARAVSVEPSEIFHPVFEISASVFEKGYAKQTLDRVEELAAFDGTLVQLPAHKLTSQRLIPADVRKDAGKWKGEIEKRAAALKKELVAKFDVVMEDARKEHLAARTQGPKDKIANIDENISKLLDLLDAENEAQKQQEKLYKQLKKEKAKKSRLISVENKIDTKKHKIQTTKRKVEQLRTDREALVDKLRIIEIEEKEKFHDALAEVKSKSSFEIAGWLVETFYRASIAVNGREHHGDVRWSSWSGRGTWGRCSTCSVPLEDGSACSCGNLLCSNHLAYCKICLEPACNEHRAVCYICSSMFCSRHSVKCEVCGQSACSNHSGVCSICSRKACVNCSQKKGLIKRELVCRICSGR
ncbi:MAG: helicase HerA-like domain-containing protein [Nitrososphaera sp.]